jgi:hypothetical protein
VDVRDKLQRITRSRDASPLCGRRGKGEIDIPESPRRFQQRIKQPSKAANLFVPLNLLFYRRGHHQVILNIMMETNEDSILKADAGNQQAKAGRKHLLHEIKH